MLEPNVMEKLGDSGWLKGRKVLIDTKYLGPAKNVIAQTRNIIQKISLPFPIAGLNLIPKSVLNDIEKNLKEQEAMFYDKVYDFEGIYADARREAQENLGGIFQRAGLSHRHRFQIQIRMAICPSVSSRQKLRADSGNIRT